MAYNNLPITSEIQKPQKAGYCGTEDSGGSKKKCATAPIVSDFYFCYFFPSHSLNTHK